MDQFRSARVRAPEFGAGTWLNTEGPLNLIALRGKPVLLDFWTFCCANCLHVIDELRALETEFGDQLQVVGVHSPKFEHEKSDQAVAAAIARYDVAHPVFNDPQLHLWQQYAVRAWPTLVLIDQAGYVIAQAAGEGHADHLAMIVRELLDGKQLTSNLHSGTASPAAQIATREQQTDAENIQPLRFPAKAFALTDSLLVTDAGHHQLVQTDLTGTEVLRRIGDGRRGAGSKSFCEPNGVTVLPADLATQLGYDVIVADTGSHSLRGVSLDSARIVATVDLVAALAGTSTITGQVPSVLSPWDVAWWPAIDKIVIAAAGVHLLLSWDPRTNVVEVLAGTTVEGLKDGPAAQGWLAQPSGLAVDGDQLWFVDSETSALRYLTAAGQLGTVIGEGLFDFGYVDGAARAARLQHPLGLAVLPDGRIAIADTYNGAVRSYDPASQRVQTIVAGLAEPSGLVVAGGHVLVIESAAHKLTALASKQPTAQTLGPRSHTDRPVTYLGKEPVHLLVSFTPPPGRHLDDRFGPATQLTIRATPSELLRSGHGVSPGLTREILLQGPVGSQGMLHVRAQAASCDEGPHASCQLARQDWDIPIQLSTDGQTGLSLELLQPHQTQLSSVTVSAMQPPDRR